MNVRVAGHRIAGNERAAGRAVAQRRERAKHRFVGVVDRDRVGPMRSSPSLMYPAGEETAPSDRLPRGFDDAAEARGDLGVHVAAAIEIVADAKRNSIGGVERRAGEASFARRATQTRGC